MTMLGPIPEGLKPEEWTQEDEEISKKVWDEIAKEDVEMERRRALRKKKLKAKKSFKRKPIEAKGRKR